MSADDAASSMLEKGKRNKNETKDIGIQAFDAVLQLSVRYQLIALLLSRDGWETSSVGGIRQFSNHGQMGISLAFPPPFFSVQSYGLYVADVWGGIFTQYQAMCYVSKHTMVYNEGE